MSDDYMPDERILEACPACGSGRLACVLHTDLDFCLLCHKAWERLAADEPYTVDGEQMAFKVPCDNCAFRGKSPEREDKAEWAYLQSRLANGGNFYCHKGVPFQAVAADGTVNLGVREFEFPRKRGTVQVNGQAHDFKSYDTDRMRMCRGFLNAHVGPLLKKVFKNEMA